MSNLTVETDVGPVPIRVTLFEHIGYIWHVTARYGGLPPHYHAWMAKRHAEPHPQLAFGFRTADDAIAWLIDEHNAQKTQNATEPDP